MLTKAVFFVFAILVPILLLNMLIAMMGNTYSQVIARSEKEWKRQVGLLFEEMNIFREGKGNFVKMIAENDTQKHLVPKI